VTGCLVGILLLRQESKLNRQEKGSGNCEHGRSIGARSRTNGRSGERQWENNTI